MPKRKVLKRWRVKPKRGWLAKAVKQMKEEEEKRADTRRFTRLLQELYDIMTRRGFRASKKTTHA